MTLLNAGYSDRSYIWAAIRSVGGGSLKLVNRWVAAILAQRAHQANLAVLRRLDERQLRDIGIDRGEIEAASPDAIRDRALRRRAMLS